MVDGGAFVWVCVCPCPRRVSCNHLHRAVENHFVIVLKISKVVPLVKFTTLRRLNDPVLLKVLGFTTTMSIMFGSSQAFKDIL